MKPSKNQQALHTLNATCAVDLQVNWSQFQARWRDSASSEVVSLLHPWNWEQHLSACIEGIQPDLNNNNKKIYLSDDNLDH